MTSCAVCIFPEIDDHWVFELRKPDPAYGGDMGGGGGAFVGLHERGLGKDWALCRPS